jgi:phasin family protein
LGATDRTKAFRSYVERSVAASFELSDKILHAKDLQDVLRIQTEFLQKQLQVLTEQSKDLGDEASKNVSEVVNIPIK